MRGLLVVALDADAAGEANAEIIRRHQVAFRRRLLEPLAGALRVLGAGVALHHQVRQIEARLRVARFGRDAEPSRRLGRVARQPGAGQVHQAERACGRLVAGLRGAAVPHRRLGMVRRQRAATRIQVADHRRRLGIALDCGAAQPGFALLYVARDALSLHQRQAKPRLRRTQPLLGRLTIPADGGFLVALDPFAALGQHAEQVIRGGEPGFGRLGEVARRLGEIDWPLGLAQQREGKAEAALSAAGLGRSPIQRLGLGEVAQLLRAGGEDERQQCLRVTRAAFGRATGP